MTARLEALTRPGPDGDYRKPSPQRRFGFGLAVVGLLGAAVALIGNLVAAGSLEDAAEIAPWTFGLTTLSFGMIKLAIAAILIGILHRLWLRVESVKVSLAVLRPERQAPAPTPGPVATPWGEATESTSVPSPLPIHTMARRMWAPMLAMGAMAVGAGFVVSVVWSGDPGSQTAAAWTQGLQFLGEGFLLGGIAFLLGSILASLRDGGGVVQHSLGLPVRTLVMPVTAKLFAGIMMLGLVVSVAQFGLYLVAAGGDGGATFAAWSAWLGPAREVGLGLILLAIVFALVTIGNVLAFQFSRIREIVATGA